MLTVLATWAGNASCARQEIREAERLSSWLDQNPSVAHAVVGIGLISRGLSGKDIGGYGAIISPDGFIVTQDFPGTADEVEALVILYDKRKFRASIFGRDQKTGLAILKVDSTQLPYLRWADCESLQVGDPVIILDPFGQAQTAAIRVLNVDLRVLGYEDFIQVEGSFQSKAFAGLLVNFKGELIGINAWMHKKMEHAGFTISCCLAKEIADRLIKSGQVVRASIGIRLHELTPEQSKTFDTKGQRGFLVHELNEQGAAYEAGVQRGDVIVEIYGKPIKSVSNFRNLISLKEVGSQVQMKVIRNGQTLAFLLQLKELPKQNDH
jgi:serine protease Do